MTALASDDAITTSGLKLPEDLRTIYKLNNGQYDNDYIGVFCGLPFLSIEEAKKVGLM